MTLTHAARVCSVLLALWSNVGAQVVFNPAATGDTSSPKTDAASPTILSVSPSPGSTVTQLTEVTVTFSEPVQGVDADDLLVNGISATLLIQSNNTFTFRFPQPAFYERVTIGWATTHGITDLASPPNAFDASAAGASWTYDLVDRTPPAIANLFPAAAAQIRALSQIEITFSEGVVGVDAGDLLINGQPATNVLAQPGAVFVFQFNPAPPGPASVAFAANHGITDVAASPNAFAGASWSYTVNTNTAAGDLVINEINAGNESGLADEDGQPEDWIEIWNRGTNAVNLANWSLSDDLDEPGLWQFPARTLGAGEYLVVFASGKDRRPAGTGNLHTSFNLGTSGEFLGLFAPDSPRRLVSAFSPNYPSQRNDVSFGYDSSRELRYFAVPTPGAPNGVSTITGLCEPVHFSAERGFYSQPFDLVLSCDTPGAVIRYTLNGSVPTLANGERYAAPIRLGATTLLRAAAFRTNLLSSGIRSHTFLFGLTAAQRSLPVISLVTAETNLTGPTGIIGISNVVQQGDGSWVPRDATGYHNPSKHGIAWERPVSVEFIRNLDNSGFQADCGMRVQGSDYQRPRTTSASKFSFRLYFRGDYGEGRLDYPLFPLSTVHRFDQIVLRAGFNDNTDPFVRDELTRRLSHDMGGVASHGNLVMLFINGVYKGYYNPCERVHEEMMQSYVGGSDNWDVVGPAFAQGSGVPGVIDGDRTAYAAMVNFINQTNAAIPSAYDEIGRRLDLTNFVDYCLLNVYCGMGDWPGNNWRAGKDRSGGIWRFVVWDGEWAMGIYGRSVTRDTFSESGPGPDDSGLGSTGNSEIAQIYQRLRASPEFLLLWADRIHKHMFNGGALTDGNITNRFGQMRAEMAGVLPNMATDILNTWVPQRRSVVFGLFNTYRLIASSNAPVFNQQGGPVPIGFNLTMQATNGGGTIYFTADGTDPRVKHTGAVAPGALAYDAPVPLSQSTVIKARTLWGTNWSAVTEAQFSVASAGVPIRITEINYNPPEGAQYEFIELMNVGTAPVDLSRMQFEGITFTFLNGTILAPRATLVLASDRNPAAFAAKYPGVVVAGYFGGGLDNAGERIALKDAVGNTVTSVDYDDEGLWPAAADGSGRSLVIVDPRGDPDDPANWRASNGNNGDPGVLLPAPTPLLVSINEVMADNVSAVNHNGTFPDWVELHNATGSDRDLSNWSLSDDGNPRKYVFPQGTVIGRNGYLVIWCDAATNTTPGMHSGFALDRNHDNVFLYDASTNRVDAVSFGQQITDLSIGRIGGWQLTQPTPNAANVAAATASAVDASINEWLANPLLGQDDWVELFNRSAVPLALRGMYLGTTGIVQQITSLSFVPPGGFIQLWCDEGVGWNHLDVKLPATGGVITLLDSLGTEVDRVIYPPQAEGITRGRLPDGSATFVNFPGSASPGATNYVINYTGPVVNEVLARNRTGVTNAATGRASDFVELFNGTAAAFDLGGMSLSVNGIEPGQFAFPSNTIIAANGFLTVWCDDVIPAVTNGGYLNTGRALEGDGGGVYLFSAAGQVVNSVEYGFQVTDRPIGRVAGGAWRLLAGATPGQTNAAAAVLGSATALRINEWMADPVKGDDWFELFNSTNVPVELSGLVLAGDPSFLATNTATRVAALSFAGANGFVKFIADGNPQNGRDHVSFSLDRDGDIVRLYRSDGSNQIDSVTFGPQLRGVSAGRLPDGASNNIVPFVGSASPAESNYQLVPGVVINELFVGSAQTNQWIELHNRGSTQAAIGGWFLSDNQADFKKFRIPDGTSLPPNGFVSFDEAEFGSASPTSFRLDRSAGGEVWLSAADALGNLTGLRAVAKYGGAPAAAALGRVENSAGVDYDRLIGRTRGQTNAAPVIGPVIISEIMYHPLPGNEEFIELHNLTNAPVPLYETDRPTNTWRLKNAVSYVFPPNTTISAGGYLLLVGFDPADTARLAAFRTGYSIDPAIPVFGPWTGSLDNGGDEIELARPNDTFTATHPFTYPVDHVRYDDQSPWPAQGVDGGGLSLQRVVVTADSSDPQNWIADLPTAGTPNSVGTFARPEILVHPQTTLAYEGRPALFSVLAASSGPLSYQWRVNGIVIPQATNAALLLDWAITDDEGAYDVVISNPSAVVVSHSAQLTVAIPAEIVSSPTNVLVATNGTAQLVVVARGSQPLTYQWRHDGVLLPGETGPILRRSPITIPDNGVYEVTVANGFGTVSAAATITVVAQITFLQHPLSQTVAVGEPITLSTSVTGSPGPFSFVWIRGVSTKMITNSPGRAFDFFTFPAPTIVTTVQYRVQVRNPVNTNGPVSQYAVITVLADTDGDGIPDAWETGYGLDPNNAADASGDADADGATNYQEYRAGTDPTNALSFLKIESMTAGAGATLRFGALSNRTYSVEYVDGLKDGALWQRLADIPARPNDRTESITDATATTNRFYRVATPRGP